MTFLVIKWVVNLFLFISVLCDKDVLFDNLYIFTTMKHLIRIFFKKVWRKRDIQSAMCSNYFTVLPTEI